MPRSQPEQFFHVILHLKEPPVDSFAFYHLCTKQGGRGVELFVDHPGLDDDQHLILFDQLIGQN